MRVYKFLPAEFAIKSLSEKRLKISQLNSVNDPFECLFFHSDDQKEKEAVKNTIDKISQESGIVCFSSNYDSTLLWAHYSDNHKGICLGFDIPDYENEKADDNLHGLVEYESEPLSLPIESLERERFVKNLLFTKFVDWKYEEERRMWAKLRPELKKDKFYFCEFEDNIKLAEIIVGIRTEPIDVEKIKEELNHYNYKIPITYATLRTKDFKIIKRKKSYIRDSNAA